MATTGDLERLISPTLEGPRQLEISRGRRALDLELELPTGPEEAKGELLRYRGLRLDEDVEGLEIRGVAPGSPAARAGIRTGDLLLRVDHTPPRDLAALSRLLTGEEDEAVWVELVRGSRQIGMLLGT